MCVCVCVCGFIDTIAFSKIYFTNTSALIYSCICNCKETTKKHIHLFCKRARRLT